MKIKSTILVVSLIAGTHLNADIITMDGSDAAGVSSFNSGANWSGDLAPTAGNDYTNYGYNLRSPESSGSFVFAGDSLTLGNGSASNANFYLKGGNSTLTINNFVVNQGAIFGYHNGGGGNLITLAGTLTIQSGGLVAAMDPYRQFNLSSTIDGAGSLTISNSGTTYLSASNTWTGGTTVSSVSDVALLIANADGSLGMGNVSVLAGGKLTLQNGTANNYIADTSMLMIAAGLADSSISLSYAGTDTIAGLSLDGGSTFLGSGTYSASSLNSLYGSNVFTGAGELIVIPEASSFSMMIGFMLFVFALRRRRL